MEIDQKVKFEAKIVENIKKTKKDIVAYEQLTKPVCPDNAIGRLSRMEAINSKSINDAALRKAKNTLAKLEHALAKIDKPEFGFCRQCGESIPSARLIIMPESDLCVLCAEKLNG